MEHSCADHAVVIVALSLRVLFDVFLIFIRSFVFSCVVCFESLSVSTCLANWRLSELSKFWRELKLFFVLACTSLLPNAKEGRAHSHTPMQSRTHSHLHATRVSTTRRRIGVPERKCLIVYVRYYCSFCVFIYTRFKSEIRICCFLAFEYLYRNMI